MVLLSMSKKSKFGNININQNQNQMLKIKMQKQPITSKQKFKQNKRREYMKFRVHNSLCKKIKPFFNMTPLEEKEVVLYAKDSSHVEEVKKVVHIEEVKELVYVEKVKELVNIEEVKELVNVEEVKELVNVEEVKELVHEEEKEGVLILKKQREHKVDNRCVIGSTITFGNPNVKSKNTKNNTLICINESKAGHCHKNISTQKHKYNSKCKTLMLGAPLFLKKHDHHITETKSEFSTLPRVFPDKVDQSGFCNDNKTLFLNAPLFLKKQSTNTQMQQHLHHTIETKIKTNTLPTVVDVPKKKYMSFRELLSKGKLVRQDEFKREKQHKNHLLEDKKETKTKTNKLPTVVVEVQEKQQHKDYLLEDIKETDTKTNKLPTVVEVQEKQHKDYLLEDKKETKTKTNKLPTVVQVHEKQHKDYLLEDEKETKTKTNKIPTVVKVQEKQHKEYILEVQQKNAQRNLLNMKQTLKGKQIHRAVIKMRRR
jgi:hypothetical protein